MKIINLIEQNKAVCKGALEMCLDVKMATDSPGALGSSVEMRMESLINKKISKTGHILLTNKGIKRLKSRGHRFDFSVIGANSYETFTNAVKSSGTIVSSSDLYLFKIEKDVVRLVDAASWKTSTSAGVKVIYYHNDADGSLHRCLKKKHYPSVGQVVMMTLDDKTGVAKVYYSNGTLKKFVDLFTKFT